MTDRKPEETQAELFQEFSGHPKKPERFPSLHRAQKPILLSTSVEQIIFVSILLILAFCLVFFLGVIRGKFLSTTTERSTTRPINPVLQTMPSQQPVSHMLAMPQYRQAMQKNTVSLPARTPAPAADKPYMIQLVTYKRADLAERDMQAFRRNGYYSIVVPSGDYYQVCVGQYASKDEAKKDLKFFSSKYRDCFLRRR